MPVPRDSDINDERQGGKGMGPSPMRDGDPLMRTMRGTSLARSEDEDTGERRGWERHR